MRRSAPRKGHQPRDPVVLTGIRPEVARAFLAVGADLSGIITCGTLQSGIVEAMALSIAGLPTTSSFR